MVEARQNDRCDVGVPGRRECGVHLRPVPVGGNLRVLLSPHREHRHLQPAQLRQRIVGQKVPDPRTLQRRDLGVRRLARHARPGENLPGPCGGRAVVRRFGQQREQLLLQAGPLLRDLLADAHGPVDRDQLHDQQLLTVHAGACQQHDERHIGGSIRNDRGDQRSLAVTDQPDA